MRTREKQFRHSKISVEDVKQTPIKVDTNSGIDFLKICNEFNNASDIDKKLELSYLLPEELFCTCRFCGKRVMTKNSKLEFNTRKNTILVKIPGVRYRIINGVTYELSCCQTCLLEHFKDCPPKSEKYLYMKANKFGAYSFGYGYEEYKKICSQTVGITEDVMIRKWGEEEGKKRWKSYCDKQAETNTFEYKQEKYGWTKEQFEEFNKSRAVTLELCIERHGEELGRKMWDDYCERQRYTNSLEYMIEEYGEEAGTKKFEDFALARANSGAAGYSEISQDLFFNIINKIQNTDNIFFYKLNKEYSVQYSTTAVFNLDFYDKRKNLVIEFLGDYWHANPKIYDAESVFNRSKTPILAKQIWKYDEQRKNKICKVLNNPIYIEVWESDWKENPDKVIEEILKYYND